jgi:hypothetical protein
MEKVFLTKSNVEKLIHHVEFTKIYNFDDIVYSGELRKILSEPELKYLLIYKEIVEGIGDIPIFNKNQPKKEKTSKKKTDIRMIYEGGTPSFHLNKSCSILTRDYENFEIPVEIKDSNTKEYRKFFLEKIKLFKNNPSAFYAQAEIRFNVRIQNIKRHSAVNSGLQELDNIELVDPEVVINMLKKHLYAMENFRNINPVHKKIIDNKGYGSHKTKDKYPEIEEWHKLKATLKDLLKRYFVSKFNPDFEFDRSVLEQCDYKLCNACLSKYQQVES